MSKICLVSSTGGHFTQLKKIVKVVEKYDYFIVTENNETKNNTSGECKEYYLIQQERKNWLIFLIVVFLNTIKSFFIIIKERPKIIITTGAGSVIPMCILGKVLGAKLIFIESFAKINSPTMTGKLLCKFSNRFYVQWEEMLEVYPKAMYRGTLY
ncbi:UDP-N-acetylglucosamine transferase subunit ALG14 [Neobacillus mesonae]|nr:UDP-N-acetylglucosamine transferase subunit ALG14 [Neobacillus mesonae]